MTKYEHVELIKDECRAAQFLPTQTAYVLATVEHETNGTYEPVREAYYVSKSFKGAEQWRMRNLRYYPYYGRGYVQITWKENYEKFGRLMNQPFVEIPDLVMVPKNAVEILVRGFNKGLFTGKKISDYVNLEKKDYHHARRCINGLDRARKIARMAQAWEKRLSFSE